MKPFNNIPDEILSDISVYLEPEIENIIDAISPFDTKHQTKKGYVWIILTNLSFIFHTCEPRKEPLIALIKRTSLKEIEYFERYQDILLTFIPFNNNDNLTKFSFNLNKKQELEKFCEDVAELITYKKETKSGIEVICSAINTEPETAPQAPTKIETKQEPLKDNTLKQRIQQLTAQDNVIKEEIKESKKRIPVPLNIASTAEQQAEIDSKPSSALSAINLDLTSHSLKSKDTIAVRTVDIKQSAPTQDSSNPAKNTKEDNLFTQLEAIAPPKAKIEPASNIFLHLNTDTELEGTESLHLKPEKTTEAPIATETIVVPPLRKQIVKTFEMSHSETLPQHNLQPAIPEPIQEPSNIADTTEQIEEGLGYKPISIVLMTAISLVIAYIWYKFFKFIDKYET